MSSWDTPNYQQRDLAFRYAYRRGTEHRQRGDTNDPIQKINGCSGRKLDRFRLRTEVANIHLWTKLCTKSSRHAAKCIQPRATPLGFCIRCYVDGVKYTIPTGVKSVVRQWQPKVEGTRLFLNCASWRCYSAPKIVIESTFHHMHMMFCRSIGLLCTDCFDGLSCAMPTVFISVLHQLQSRIDRTLRSQKALGEDTTVRREIIKYDAAEQTRYRKETLQKGVGIDNSGRFTIFFMQMTLASSAITGVISHGRNFRYCTVLTPWSKIAQLPNSISEEGPELKMGSM